MSDARHVQFARELAARDERIAAALAAVRELQADVEELRAHGEAAVHLAATYPAEETRLGEALAAAAADLERREAEAAAAEAELARAKQGEPQAEARRAVTRTSDAAASAQKKLARITEERDALAADAARLETEIPRLEHRAGDLAARLAAAPRALSVDLHAGGVLTVVAWAARAKAALFVAAGNLETERETIVREANELAAFAFGEPTAATSVRLVADRIEHTAPEDTMRASPS